MMRTLILDGAIGTALLKKGFKPPFENLNITHPEVIKSIHQSYIASGSEILLTHTFNAKTLEQCEAAWNNIKDLPVRKFASIGPEAHVEVILDYFQDKVERFVFETIYTLDLANDLLSKYHHLDPIFSFCLKPKDFKSALKMITQYRISTIGLNCLDGFKDSEELLNLIPKHYEIYFKPNAGLQNLAADEFKEQMEVILKNHQLTYVGGCCGTDATYIKTISDLLS